MKIFRIWWLMALALVAGCVSQVLVLDAVNPSVRVSRDGFLLDDQPTTIAEVVEALEDCGVAHDRTIHIRVDNDVTDLKPARQLMGMLAKAGYTRPVLVTRRHAESANRTEAETMQRQRH